ncbi:MAG: 16S rRNA (uracil(1498)-N(3))-methyltransferase [Clostridia bacterium]|nr:16S rRNA (uracil(1498)-N(3))-methyltransferase [Clostridia bacterium]
MDNRYYFEKVINNSVELDKTETGHLVKVRRAKVGDTITGFCGDGFDYTLKIKKIGKTVTCQVVNKQPNQATDVTPVTVFLATTKNDALNESVDNLTQLNVKNIVVFDCAYSVASIDSDKIAKLCLKSIQACKQCERADFVNIASMKFKQVIESLKEFDLVLFAYENTTNPFIADLKDYKGKKIALIVGCEGGFSTLEAEELSKYAKTISLGKTILRAPVACTALTSAVMSGLGEWGAG